MCVVKVDKRTKISYKIPIFIPSVRRFVVYNWQKDWAVKMIREKRLIDFGNATQMISIIVPVYNVAQYLERCIRSILGQSYPQIEIILVDDGSTDGSGEICDRWQKKYQEIVVIHQKNNGVSSARNAGLRRATGMYVGFVDPDDYIDENMYRSLYACLIDNDADVAACSWLDEYEDGRKNVKQTGMKDSNMVMTGDEAIAHDLYHGMYITCNKLLSRKACCNVFYDEDIINGEDRLFDVMVLLNADKVVYIADPYYHYCHRVNSAGTKGYTHKDLSLITACQKIKELVHGRSVSLEKIAEANVHHAYVQMLSMMNYNFIKYRDDGYWCVNNLRTELWTILLSPYHNVKFKVKTLLIFLAPKLMMLFLRRRIS